MTYYCVFLSGATYEVRPLSSEAEAAVAYCPNGNSAFLVCDALNARERPTPDHVAAMVASLDGMLLRLGATLEKLSSPTLIADNFTSPDRVAAIASAVRALSLVGRDTDAEGLAVTLVREAKALAEGGSTK